MLYLKTFGGLWLEGDDLPATGAGVQRRPLALLAYVAAAGEAGRSRDKVLACLWADRDPARARGALAQTLYALRRDTGRKDLFVEGGDDLRLNPAALRADVADLHEAAEAGDAATVAALYTGPFLDGVYVPNAPDFERWADEERAVRARQAARALEALAERAERVGDAPAAAERWRRVLALDPLSSRVTLRLMEALSAAGDPAAAVQQAAVHATLLRDELDLPPDAGVAELAERLRAGFASSSPPRRTPPPPPPPPPPAPPEPARADADPPSVSHPAPTEPVLPVDVPEADETARPAARRPRRRVALGAALGGLVLVALGVLAVAGGTGGWRGPAAGVEIPSEAALPVAAVGHIEELGAADSAVLAPAVRALLAGNLARVPGLRVVSHARLAELAATLGSAAGPDALLVRSARAAGAAVLLEGTLVHGEGPPRLELRLVEVEGGAVRGAYRVEGRDAMVLADLGAAEVARGMGFDLASTAGPAASPVAYRFYEQGLKAAYEGDRPGARRMFEAAFAEDTTMAMAAFHLGEASGEGRYLDLALRLAERAPDFERLLIRGRWGVVHDDPALFAVTDTLVIRYPHEPDAHLLRGKAMIAQGDMRGAVAAFRRVLELDSLGLRTRGPTCRACEAWDGIAHVHGALDSLAAAERVGRRLVEVRPDYAGGWNVLRSALLYGGRYDEAARVQARAEALPDWAAYRQRFDLEVWIRSGDFARADRLLRELAQSGDPAGRTDALWLLTISLRNQGRLREALEAANQAVRLDPAASLGQHRAQVLLEMGRAREAAALFERLATEGLGEPVASRRARHHAWRLTLAANAHAAAGDTARLRVLADSVERVGRGSAYGRDHLLHHHVRGLLLRARGDEAGAIAQFRRAVFSPTLSNTRTNLELARALIATGRPREAVPVAGAALRGSLEAGNLYVTRTELHELLGDAWHAAGRPDSAAVHYRRAARDWTGADPSFAARRERALARAGNAP